ncbi:restriction endonuclease subunit S [Clostridium saccharoperbutylacetonicum]
MKFKEFCEFQEGYVNPSQKISNYFDGDIKWIRATDLNNSYVFNTSRTLTKEGFESAGKSAKLFKPNTICISKSGTIGRLGILKDYMCGNRATINIDIDSNKMNMKYVFYWLMFNNKYIQNLSVGSVQKNLYISVLEDLEIEDIPLDKQEKIVSILSSLDDKIELNNEMNKTLEEMAQAIFKSWFVEFEIFKDGEFDENELGLIPKGWKTLELSELGNIITGKTPSKNNLEHFGNEYKFITPKDINGDMFITKSERGLSNEGYEKMKKNMHCKYSIGVSCIGSDLGEVYLNNEDGFTNQQINTLTLNNYKYYPYVYICLKNMKDEFKNMASGSAVPIINKTTFSKIKIVVPSEKYMDDFYNKVNSIFNKILININQNEELKEIRDTLLPKLISGEIQI